MTSSRVWLSGFLLLGVLLGLLGSLLVVWQYHIDVEPQLIGLHFLALNAGYVVAAVTAQRLLPQVRAKTLARIASGTAFASLILLVWVAPPVAVGWRLSVIAIVGLSAGALGTSLLYGSERSFRSKPAQTIGLAGVLFGSGCLLVTLITGTTYFFGPVRIQAACLAVVPLIFFVLFSRIDGRVNQAESPGSELKIQRDMLGDLRSIATVLFSLLLFFQFGNEGALAGWLPLFLVHRLGSNPALAIGVLAIYFLVLTVGRLIAHRLLRRWNHRKFLLASIAAAVSGFLLLSLSTSLALATVGVAVIGAGFAPIYPLIAERLDERFSFHPGFYNGTISIAVTGAMSAPWLLGLVDEWLGMRYVMLVPALGSVVVLLLSLLLMFEAHLMGDRPVVDKPAEKVRSARAGS